MHTILVKCMVYMYFTLWIEFCFNMEVCTSS